MSHVPGEPQDVGGGETGPVVPGENRAPVAPSRERRMEHEYTQDTSYLRKVVGASMAGTVVEWYEFFLYGTAVTLVFGKLFFPSGNELVGIMAGFATYAVGFVARPIGGIIFGHIGDRIGRKSLLQLSLVLIGGSTFLMGCLPTYHQVGAWAPGLLVALRFIQGFALGGEWGGAVLLVTEHSPNRSRGFWGSWPQAGVPLGNMVATIVLLVLSATLTTDAFESWGWRVGFWLSVIIVAIGFYIRTKVTDSPIFQEAKAEADAEAEASYGLVEVFKRYPRGVFTAMGLRFAENIVYYMVVTFSITYLKHLKLDTTEILYLLLVAHVIHSVYVPFVGHLSDRVGRRPLYALGAVLTGVWPWIGFTLFDTKQPMLILLGILSGLAAHGLMYAVQPSIMAEMFPTRMRYSGVSIGYQLTSIVAGSVAPLIATALLDRYGSWVPIGYYLVFAAIVTLIAVAVLRETKGASLVAIDEEDMRRLQAEKDARNAANAGTTAR